MHRPDLSEIIHAIGKPHKCVLHFHRYLHGSDDGLALQAFILAESISEILSGCIYKGKGNVDEVVS